MNPNTVPFEILDYQTTPIGDISLRRRFLPLAGGTEIYEVKLGDEFLMTSLFHASEVALAELALSRLTDTNIDVVVGGLGLGYTAVEALKDKRVDSLLVVELLAPVIDWHLRGLVPLGKTLTDDARCRLVEADFFKASTSQKGFDPVSPERKFHVILLDIDHSPKMLLNPSSAAFYELDGLQQLKRHLHANGIFALWSNDPPDHDFTKKLVSAFGNCESHVVEFYNVLQDKNSFCTVYLAHKDQ